MTMKHAYRIIFDCPDRVGIVTRDGDFIAQNDDWICDARHHSDSDTNRFFSRVVVKTDSLSFGIEELREKFTPIAEDLDMNWTVVDSDVPKRVVIMASKGANCLTDLFDRMRYKELSFEVVW